MDSNVTHTAPEMCELVDGVEVEITHDDGPSACYRIFVEAHIVERAESSVFSAQLDVRRAIKP